MTSSELLSAASYVTSPFIWLKTVFSWSVTCFSICSKVWGLFVSFCLSLAAFRSCERTKHCTCFSSLWQHVFIWHQRRRRMWVVTSSTWDKDIVNITIRESGCLWEVSTSAWCSVSVEAQTDSLQHPVWVVLGGGQVRLKHQPHTHGIPACGRGVDGGPQRVLWNKHTQQLDRHPDRDLQRSVRPEHSEVTPVTSGGELLWGRLWGSAAPQP